MEEKITILPADLEILRAKMAEKEKSTATIEKYLHDAGEFIKYLGGRQMTQQEALNWKRSLEESGLCPSTINCRIAAANALFAAAGFKGIRLKALKVQRKMFREDKRDLSIGDYRRLVSAARSSGDERLALLFETICSTGIRVSEVRYITVEAAKKGCAQVSLKGKIRTILIPGKLGRRLLHYAKSQKIWCGEIFVSKSGRGLSRGRIWAMMKNICKAAGVEEAKVFPHNLRHLFARTFYKQTKDVVKLSDVLGHSSISTTRIYLISTGRQHRKCLETLHLVC